MNADLDRVPLGRTDMQITRVGLGAWAIGGNGWAAGWGSQDDNDSVATIRHAIDSGINWIDTAAIYGHGHSEEVVAAALRGVSDADRPLVFTKGGLAWDESDHMAVASRRGSADGIHRDVDESLRRLGVERIDLFQMHWPPQDGSEIEEYWTVFAELKEAGKLRAIGLSNHEIAALQRAEAIAHVDTLQPQFSAIRTEAQTDGLLDWCADNGTGVIVYSPMGSGILTGAITAERVAAMPEDDWRRRNAAFTTDLDRNLARGRALDEVAQKHGVSQASAAVAWTLGFRGVTAAIVGARTPEQIDGWIGGASVRLTQDDYALVGGPTPAEG
jgi:aryl-alcohol dehydrogenase-like predicted oxidoreductase